MNKVMLVFDEPSSCAKCPISYTDHYYSDGTVTHCVMMPDGDIDNQNVCDKYKDYRAPFCMLQPAPEWIKCVDAMPEAAYSVLVYVENCGITTARFMDYYWRIHDITLQPDEISYWMKLPSKPPKDAKEGSVE